MKRLFLIRHIRYFYHRIQFNYWWRKSGQYFWLIPSDNDLDYLKRIWEGEI